MNKEKLIQEYNKNGNARWHKTIDNFGELELINNPNFVGEFKLWIMESLGVNIEKLDEICLKTKEKETIDEIINLKWSDKNIVFDFKSKTLVEH